MFKKYFYQITIFSFALLSVPLRAAHYNDRQVDNKVTRETLKKEKKNLKELLNNQANCYSADHPNKAITMENLSNVHKARRLRIREEILQKGSKNLQALLWCDSSAHSHNDGRLGKCAYKPRGAYESAKTYLEKGLAIKEKHYSTTRPSTAKTMGNLGIVFKNLRQYEKARKCYQQNIKLFTEHYGAHHPETKRVKRNLAILEEHVSFKSDQKQPKPVLENPLNQKNLNDENDDIFDID